MSRKNSFRRTKTAGEKPVFSVQVFLNNFPDPKNPVSDIKKDFIKINPTRSLTHIFL